MTGIELQVEPTHLTVDIDPLPKWKRAVDLIGASMGLVLLLPIFVVVALLIKFASRGPVFFKHQRYGFAGKPFWVWKFRTMQMTINPQAHQEHVKDLFEGQRVLKKLDDPGQLIPLGKLLRSSAIDELPQLINILKGEMSLVGPRPDVVPLDEYIAKHQVRFKVAPGMSGLWQISGKNDTTFNEMMQLDAQYVANRSFWLDVKILFLTGPTIIKLVVDELLS